MVGNDKPFLLGKRPIFRGELLGFREGSWTIVCFTLAEIGPKQETISGMGKNQHLLEGEPKPSEKTAMN